MKSLYPEIPTFNTFFLETESSHQVYVEQSGNPQGIPVLFLHGGPCSGTNPEHRRFFNPDKYHIVLFDQRGCGKSLPFGQLENNSTPYLLRDIEAIRQQLKIKQWVLFSGSWGSTLALLYAQSYPKQVQAMVIRGVFLARQKDMDWFLLEGAGRIFPEQWQHLLSNIPNYDIKYLIQSLWECLWDDDELIQKQAANAWIAWETQVALGTDFQIEKLTENPNAIKQARMEIHFAINHYFIAENQIIDNCHLIDNIPTFIVHGRYDLVCPMEAAYQLKHYLPNADYQILSHAGHIAQGDAMIDSLCQITDKIAETCISPSVLHCRVE